MRRALYFVRFLKKNVKRAAVILAAVMFTALPSRAWDEAGHKVVAYIAWQQMTPEARAVVMDVLAYATPPSSLLSLRPTGVSADMLYFMRASVWPDIVRDRREEERHQRYHQGPWHYRSFFWERAPDGRVVESEHLETARVDAVERLAFLEAAVANDRIPKAQRAIFIAWIEHLVGDIHQPLHTASRVTDLEPEGDRGGNAFRLDGRDNLHWYWDRIVTDGHPRRSGESELAHITRIARHITSRHPAEAFTDELGNRNYMAWADRGFQITIDEVYEGVEREAAPSAAYEEKSREIAENAIALAGYRLGALMNRLFG